MRYFLFLLFLLIAFLVYTMLFRVIERVSSKVVAQFVLIIITYGSIGFLIAEVLFSHNGIYGAVVGMVIAIILGRVAYLK